MIKHENCDGSLLPVSNIVDCFFCLKCGYVSKKINIDSIDEGCKSLKVYTLEEANELFDNVEGVEVYLKADIDSLKKYYLDARDNPEKYPELVKK
jgi:hypothetical protein